MQNRNFKPFPVLKTERLTLRQLATSDDNEIFALRSNELVNKYLGRKPADSIDDARNFIQVINENIEKNNSLYWAIALKEADKLIGTICLYDFSDDNAKAEIGYELLPPFQGKGIMQEAISPVLDFATQQLGLRSIDAYTHAENVRSTKLLEQYNFQHTDTDGDFMVYRYCHIES